jgi:hypothetical protein
MYEERYPFSYGGGNFLSNGGEEENPLLNYSRAPQFLPQEEPQYPELQPEQGYGNLPEGFGVNQPQPVEEKPQGFDTLPEGFTLDQPEGFDTLPEGFKVDESDQATPEEWKALTPFQKRQSLEKENKRNLQDDIIARRNEIANEEFAPPENWAALSREEKTQLQQDFVKNKQVYLKQYDTTETERGHGDIIKDIQGQKEQNTADAFRDEIIGRLRATVFSPTAGVTDIGSGLIDTLSHAEAVGLGVKPEDTTLHALAEGMRGNAKDLVGEEYADTAIPQIARGVGTSLAFAPAAMIGGMPVVAAMGAAQAFGPGYYEAKQKAAELGKEISEPEAYARAAVAAGLGATEGIPIGNALHRLDKLTGGAWQKMLINIGREGIEEWTQEFGQNALQGYYDSLRGLDDRDWKEILGESLSQANIAAVSGLLMGVGMNAMEAKAGTRHPAGSPEAATAGEPPPGTTTPPPEAANPNAATPDSVAPAPERGQPAGGLAGAAPPLAQKVTITPTPAEPIGDEKFAPPATPAPGVPGIPAFVPRGKEPGAALPQPAPAPGPEVQADLMATRLQSVDAELKATTDPARQSDLQAEKLQLETKLRSKQVVDQTREQVANLEANQAPATAKAVAQVNAQNVVQANDTVDEIIDEITPGGTFAPESGIQPAGVQPAAGAVPVPQVQISPVEHEEVSVVRPGIKGQEAAMLRPSQQIAQHLQGVTVEVERVSPTGERVAVQQDAAKALAEVKQDRTAFELLLQCID